MPHTTVEAPAESPWQRLDALLDRYDADFEADVASQTAWGATLRLTLTDPAGAPSRSITFHAVGGATPADVAVRVLDDADAWLRDSGIEPLPVRRWMREDRVDG
jgi:hypothetical protein